MIQSLSGKQIKNLIALQNKQKIRNELGQFVVEGVRICSEIPKDMVVKLYINESFAYAIETGKADFDLGEDYEIVSDSVFNQITQTVTPQGVLAVVKQPVYKLEDIMGKGKKTLLFLEDIRDPGNLGTIIRTAEGADVDAVIMSKGTVDIFNPKVIRSTMGAIYRMPFVYVEDFKQTIIDAKSEGIHFYAAHLKGKNDYGKINYDIRSAVMIGNEAHGLSDDIADLADELVKIPMTGEVESLNAAIAAAVFMYEIYRQRR